MPAGYSSSSGSSGSQFSGFMAAKDKEAKDKEAAEAEGSEGSGSGSGSRCNALWGSRVAKFLSSCSGSLGSTGMSSFAPLLLTMLVRDMMP